MDLQQRQEIYLAVTADMSQIRDGRDVDKLRSNMESRGAEPGDEILNISTHKVHGGDDLEAKALMCARHYRPTLSRVKAEMSDKLCAIEKQEKHANDGRPRINSSSITISNHEKKEPISHRQRWHDVIENSVHKGQCVSMSRRHSADIVADFEMSSSPSTPARSNVTLRRKSAPQHRDCTINQNVLSIMKQPKYSSGFGGESLQSPDLLTKSVDYSNLCDVSRHCFNLTEDLRLTILSPNQLEKGLSSNLMEKNSSNPPNRNCPSKKSEDEDWLPKGVEFNTSMEVYVFESH
ncbi:hypothetical protein ACHAW6_014195 [Cyclotella cf. meneghiniana]